MSGGFVMRPYYVSVPGYSPYFYPAPTASKARAKAYRAYTEARQHVSFKEFMGLSRVALGDAPPGFGDPINVSSKPAFLIERNSATVRFVWPGADFILNSHPLDVEPTP